MSPEDPPDPASPRDPESADDWTALGDRYDAKVRMLSAQLAAFTGMRDKARAIAADMRGERLPTRIGPLTDTHPMGTVLGTSMQAQSATVGGNISAAKVKTRLPFQLALIKRGISLPGWVNNLKKHKVDVEVAKSWTKARKKGGRRIPRSWANRIAKEFIDDDGNTEVPATEESWPNGISEDK